MSLTFYLANVLQYGSTPWPASRGRGSWVGFSLRCCILIAERTFQLTYHTAASYLPEFYYEVLLGGKWFRAIDAVHEKYGSSLSEPEARGHIGVDINFVLGPVVRISPREVHFDDADMIDTLYPLSGKKINKPIDYGKRSGSW